MQRGKEHGGGGEQQHGDDRDKRSGLMLGIQNAEDEAAGCAVMATRPMQ